MSLVDTLNQDCVSRPRRFWFPARYHQPLLDIDGDPVSLYYETSWHVNIGRTSLQEGTVVHVVGCVCRHCGKPYFEEYHWTGSINWIVGKEKSPVQAKRDLAEAFEKWQYRQRVREEYANKNE